MHHKSEQLYRQDKFEKMESVVDVYVAYQKFPLFIENIFKRFRTSPC